MHLKLLSNACAPLASLQVSSHIESFKAGQKIPLQMASIGNVDMTDGNLHALRMTMAFVDGNDSIDLFSMQTRPGR